MTTAEGDNELDCDGLVQSSPGVTALIRRYLGDSAVTTVSQEYTHAVEGGGNHEPGVVREEGVSFNPRLARILTVLLQEGKVRDLSVLCFALRCAGIAEDRDDGPLPHMYRSVATLREALSESSISDATIALVASVYCLDAVRHLHMTTFSLEVRKAFLQDMERSLAELSTYIGDSKVPQRFAHGILLQRRRLTADEAS
jgi:hypothetical protein